MDTEKKEDCVQMGKGIFEKEWKKKWKQSFGKYSTEEGFKGQMGMGKKRYVWVQIPYDECGHHV